MHSETILSVENISKQYRLGQVGTGTISHDLNRWWSKIRGKEDPWNAIMSGALAGGIIQARRGWPAILMSGFAGGLIGRVTRHGFGQPCWFVRGCGNVRKPQQCAPQAGGAPHRRW